MKLTTERELAAFLNSICYAMCNSQDDYNLIKSLGIKHSDWPDELQLASKTAINDLESIKTVKGYPEASLEVRSRYDDFRAFNLMTNFPADYKDIAIMYKQNIDCWRAYFKAKKIVQDKFNYTKYLAELKSFDQNDDFFFSIDENIQSFFENKEKQISEKKAVVTIPDWPILSKSIGGWNPQRVSMINAKSGVGKTRLLTNLSLSFRKIAPVYYFNMEMGKDDFTQLFVQIGSHVSYEEINSGRYAYKLKEISDFIDTMKTGHKIFATNGKSMTIEQITSKAVVHCKDHPMSFVIIDYDQKIRSSAGGEEWMQILRAVEALEDLAKEVNAHVIIIGQADDNGEAKSSKRAKQPVSTMLSLTTSDSGQYVLESKKNRWGPPFRILLNVQETTGFMSEDRLDNQSKKSYVERLRNEKTQNAVQTRASARFGDD